MTAIQRTKAKIGTIAKKPLIDWELVEQDYRAGLLSLREMAAAHGVSHVSIKKHADKHGWARDLVGKIQAKADDLVNRTAVTTVANTRDGVSDRQVVEANALRIAQIRCEHRADISRMRALVLQLLAECEVEAANPALFAQFGEILKTSDDNGNDRLNEAYRKAISLPTRIKGVKDLADTLKALVAIEREAYGLSKDAPEQKEKSLSQQLAEFVGQIHRSGAGRIQMSQPREISR